MAVRKIAISVPEDVLRNVDRLAKKSKTTRSSLISGLLKTVSHAANQKEMTLKINQLFENSDLLDEQARISTSFLHAGNFDKDSKW